MTFFANLSPEEAAAARALADKMKAALLPVDGLRFAASVEMEAAAHVGDALLLSDASDELIEAFGRALQYVGLVTVYQQLTGDLAGVRLVSRDG